MLSLTGGKPAVTASRRRNGAVTRICRCRLTEPRTIFRRFVSGRRRRPTGGRGISENGLHFDELRQTRQSKPAEKRHGKVSRPGTPVLIDFSELHRLPGVVPYGCRNHGRCRPANGKAHTFGLAVRRQRRLEHLSGTLTVLRNVNRRWGGHIRPVDPIARICNHEKPPPLAP